MNTHLNISNSDVDHFDGQTLALSESETEEILKDELQIVMTSNDKHETTSKEINSTIRDEYIKYNTNESVLLNKQSNLSSDNKEVLQLKTFNDNKNNQLIKVDVINSDDSEIGINDKITPQIKINSLDKSLNSNSDNDDGIGKKKRSKFISYSDSDEDFEKKYVDDNLEIEKYISENSNSKDVKYKKISTIIDSESDEEHYPTDEQNNAEYIQHHNKNQISDIEKNHKKISTIIDSESDEEELHLNEKGNYGNFNSEAYTNIQTDCDKKARKQRASAKIALDSISAIKSETQRMHRENQINVPYHRPRNCTLKEFMGRKSQDVLRKVAIKSIGKGLSLKMTEQELENYAEYLENREKESQELFANEEELLPSVTTINKEYKEPIPPMDDINIDKIQNKIEIPPKIKILSDVLICPPVTSASPTLNISNLKKLLTEDKDLIASPTLKGNSKYIIDLESGDMIPSTLETAYTSTSGVDKLFERFLKSSGCKKQINTGNSNTTNNKETTKRFNGNNSLIDDSEFNNIKIDKKPGASYVALKNNLRKLIFESRKNVLVKKINDFKIENKMVEQICAEEDEEDDYVSENDEENQDFEKYNYQIEDNLDEEISNFENEENKSEDIGDKSEESHNDDADDESDDSIEDDNVRNKKLSRRVIKQFEDDSDSDSNEYNFSNTSAKKSNELVINEKQEEELLELCSGKFELTQQQSEFKVNGFVIPTTQLATQFDESQLEALCTGTFTDKNTEIASGLTSDEDENEDEWFKKPHKRNNKAQKTTNKISYSDDEDNINNFENDINKTNLENYEDEEEENEDEQIETYIDYDSDENEIEVEMTKRDRKIRANDFVEKEADLSGSDVGSADEDERNLDRYDIELGDEDQFDQDKLQSELGKIHMRKMMDEDARELKKMQELLFDDEENDGLGRQKQFRWRKTENGFDININADDDQENKESGEDDENEEQWRKMKHEREILLMEKQQSVEGNKVMISPLKLINSNKIDIDINSPKVLISKSKKNIDLKKIENDSPFLISKNNSDGIRGSFLKRDKEILSKVAASLISSKDINNLNNDSSDDIGRVKTTTGKYNNFVFTIMSQPPIQQTNKRKLSDISDNDINKTTKKSKLISPKIKNNLIDHLDRKIN